MFVLTDPAAVVLGAQSLHSFLHQSERTMSGLKITAYMPGPATSYSICEEAVGKRAASWSRKLMIFLDTQVQLWFGFPKFSSSPRQRWFYLSASTFTESPSESIALSRTLL